MGSLLGGGGGGGGSAQADEAARRRRINDTIAVIRSAFETPGREKAFTDQRQNVLDLNLADLNQEKERADRELGFSLARTGTAGGSADADRSALVLERFDDGVRRVSEFADNAANRLRAADERSKQGLIRDAQTGLDATTARQQALDALAVNLTDAQGATRLEGLGNLFADLVGQSNAAANARGIAGARLPFAEQSLIAPRSPGRGSAGTTTRIG